GPRPVQGFGRGDPRDAGRGRSGWVRTLFGVRPHIPSGRLRVLAITAAKRSPAAPEYPTVVEAGVPGYVVDQWYGIITGLKVPAVLVRKLNARIVEALKSPDVAKRLM